MKRSSASHLNCSIARSLEILGEWWTLLIVRDAFFGVRRFDDFVNDLGISRGVLTDRLATLVDHEVLVKKRYHEAPDRFEYRLTDKGRDLFPVLMALMQWGDKWLSTPQVGGAPVIVEHNDCGHDISGALRCGHCQQPTTAATVTARTGPGSEPDGNPDRAHRTSPGVPADQLRGDSPDRDQPLRITANGTGTNIDRTRSHPEFDQRSATSPAP